MSDHKADSSAAYEEDGVVGHRSVETGTENGPGSAATANKKIPTVDGVRVEIDEINVGDSDGSDASFLSRLRRGFSQFLAGMYTGVKCGGIPHSHHTYGKDRDRGPL